MSISDNYTKYLEISHKPLENLDPNLKSWSKKYDRMHKKIKLKPIISGGNSLIDRVSILLFLTYGITNWHASCRANAPFIRQFKRPIPSGGALYPNEIYVLINMDSVTIDRGIYHYDPYSHELTLIKTGVKIKKVIDSVFKLNSVSEKDFLLFTTCLLDKNSYRYTDWSYRIQNIDTGVLLHRIYDITNYLENDILFYLNFNDEQLSEILGLDESEGVLGVCKISDKNLNESETIPRALSSNEKLNKLNNHNLPQTFSKNYNTIIDFHNSTKIEEDIELPSKKSNENSLETITSIKLPKPKPIKGIEVDKYLYTRYTTFNFFQKEAINIERFSNVLYRSFKDIEKFKGIPNLLRIYIIVRNVTGLSPGLYSYNPNSHVLDLHEEKDLTQDIKKYIVHPTLDVNKIGATFILTGNYNTSCKVHNRTYRYLNISAGVQLGFLVTSSIHSDLGRYPMLSYDVKGIKELLNLDRYTYPLTMFLSGVQTTNLMKIKYPMFI
ncbi:SagB family peptide dehydrogenase [Pseudalkalibacillus sp. JSM 102089]|uniref:SagB family peptide dehydrogenase n=1 Tax=Pseudalkalibacillus sp. JSM 102089 TaxID=3229856 RepID=UPI0035269A9B